MHGELIQHDRDRSLHVTIPSLDTEPFSALPKKRTLTYIIIRSLCQFYTAAIFWVLGHGLWAATHLSALTNEQITFYGINRVSGFYGPGAWAAWVFTVAACCIDRLLQEIGNLKSVQAGTSKPRGFSGLDLNLVTALTYPSIAAIDLLLHLPQDFQRSLISADIGCLAAAFAAVKFGAVFGVLLCSICVLLWTRHKSGLMTFIYCCGATSLMVVSLVIFDIAYFNTLFTPFTITASDLLHTKTETDTFGGPADHDFEPLFDQRVLAGTLGQIFGVLSLLGYSFWFSISLKFTRRGALDTLSLCTVGLLLLLFIFSCWNWLFHLFFDMFLVCIWIGLPVPRTTASILDLDQMSALILGGALVVISIGVERLSEHKAMLGKIFLRRRSGSRTFLN